MNKLTCRKADFDLEDGIHYLNGAAYSPQLSSALTKVTTAIQQKTQRPYTIGIREHFDTADAVRNAFAGLINAESGTDIAIIPSVSYGLATIAANVQRLKGIEQKKNIVMVQDEFPNSVYAFQRVANTLGLSIKTVALPVAEQAFGKQWNDDLLNSITEDTALLVVQNIHWMYGVRFDLEALGRRCREVGALFIVDGSQSIGILPFDVKTIQPDALITATYKWMMGTYGTALAYFGPFFENGIPIEESWMNRSNSRDFAALTKYTDEYMPGAMRYNSGEFSQFFQLPILLDALEQLQSWGIAALQDYSTELTAPYLKALAEMGCSYAEAGYNAGHLTGIRLPDAVDMQLLIQALQHKRVYVSVRSGIVRLSVHIYNEPADIEAFIAGMRTCL